MKDLQLILDGWDTVEPSPGFAERVIAATEPRPSHRWSWLPLVGAAAIAAAVVLVPLLAPRHAPSAVAHVEDLDAGLRTD